MADASVPPAASFVPAPTNPSSQAPTALIVGADPAAAFRRYERVRAPRTASMAAIARRNARVGAIEHPLVCWLRDTAIRLMPRRVILKAVVDLGRAPSAGEP